MPNKESAVESPHTKGDAWLGGALLVFAVTVLILSRSIHAIGLGDNFDPGSKAFPMGLAMLLALGGLVEIWKWRGSKKNPEKGELTEASHSEPSTQGGSKSVLMLLACFLVYVIALPWLGFALTTLIMATGMMALLGNSWKLSAAVSVILITIIYCLFVMLFKVPLPGGVFNLPF